MKRLGYHRLGVCSVVIVERDVANEDNPIVLAPIGQIQEVKAHASFRSS